MLPGVFIPEEIKRFNDLVGDRDRRSQFFFILFFSVLTYPNLIFTNLIYTILGIKLYPIN